MAVDLLVLSDNAGTILEAHRVFRPVAPAVPDGYSTKVFDRPKVGETEVSDEEIKKGYMVDPKERKLIKKG